MEQFKRLFISRSIPSSYIFCGTDGSGRDFIARMFAKILLCEEDDLFFCDKCESCKLFDEGIHPGMLTISEYKVEHFKEIRSIAYRKPLYGNRKVFVFERSENFNISCANSILKLLEEPPENIFFLLTTQNLRKILPTIKSRCFKVDTAPDSLESKVNYDLFYMIGKNEYETFTQYIDSIRKNEYEIAMIQWKEFFQKMLNEDISEKESISKFFYCVEHYIDFILAALLNDKENAYSLIFVFMEQINVIKKYEIMKNNKYLNFDIEIIQQFLEKFLALTMNNNTLTLSHREHIIDKVKKGMSSLFLNINKELILFDVVNSLKNENLGSSS